MFCFEFYFFCLYPLEFPIFEKTFQKEDIENLLCFTLPYFFTCNYISTDFFLKKQSKLLTERPNQGEREKTPKHSFPLLKPNLEGKIKLISVNTSWSHSFTISDFFSLLYLCEYWERRKVKPICFLCMPKKQNKAKKLN